MIAALSGLVTPSVGAFGVRGSVGPVEAVGGLIVDVTVGEEGTSDRFGYSQSASVGSLSPDPASVNGVNIDRFIYDTGNVRWQLELPPGPLPKNHFESVEIEIDPGAFITFFALDANQFVANRIWIWTSAAPNRWTQADVGNVRRATFAW